MTKYKKKIIIMIAIYILLLFTKNNSSAFSGCNSGDCLTVNGKINTEIYSFINPYTGGYLVLPFNDINISTLNNKLKFCIIRTYNSRSQRLGLFGYGWMADFEASINYISETNIEILTGKGHALTFNKKNDRL